jgi:hypothetical protein
VVLALRDPVAYAGIDPDSMDETVASITDWFEELYSLDSDADDTEN